MFQYARFQEWTVHLHVVMFWLDGIPGLPRKVIDTGQYYNNSSRIKDSHCLIMDCCTGWCTPTIYWIYPRWLTFISDLDLLCGHLGFYSWVRALQLFKISVISYVFW